MKLRAVFLGIAMFIFFLGCSSYEIETLPSGCLGIWSTDAEKYKGFYFELTSNLIFFTYLTDEKEPRLETNAISRMEKRLDKVNKAYYIVYYKNEEGLELKFAFYYQPSLGGRIRLKNQERYVWRKDQG